MMLSLDTAYRSFGGEVEALSTPTICRLPDSRRHQLWAIAQMDTNAVERAMRPIKLNAKNALFAGCDEGAENWAVLASLIETCKLNGVSAEHWLADVLAKLINGWPASRLDELLPWASTYTMRAHDPRLAA